MIPSFFDGNLVLEIKLDNGLCKISKTELYNWRHKSSYPDTLPSSHKFLAKINVWGGISCKGATQFALFKNNMDSKMYNEILSDHLLAFCAVNFNYNFVLHQDNDPKHKSYECMRFLDSNSIRWLKKYLEVLIRSPPRSPDLNPIEMLWNEMKVFIRKSGCITETEVSSKINEFQTLLTKEKCIKYISRLKQV
ncbi:Transposable element Tcb2 transposase [Brachionus plicatilis]|uniref:Transposable element Tcb2 transposase n=1 Tax=Brachionus plicatilis TaxID=10195 RepID=A0A3M7SM08_BRAPC|nr:Transposable element Tcb2 transposase [Brachionus plicatilis]